MHEGASVGTYRILRKLGVGGMGAVYLGEHTMIGRLAAIKMLLPEMSVQRENVQRFFNEARATSAVSDPGIVQVFDFGFTPDNVAYIVMEFLDGERVDKRLERLGVIPPAEAVKITRQVACSLAAAHAAGIIHRDLKPENLFMVRDPEAPGSERPKILDFGIAKLGDHLADRFRTQSGVMLGTPLYMSPEQCRGGKAKIDHRADIYSLGCVLFHLITAQPPFDPPGLGALIYSHISEPPPAPSSIVRGLPLAIDELVLRCLAKSPDDRFQSMLEVQQACDALLTRMSGAQLATLVAPELARASSATVPMAPGAVRASSAVVPVSSSAVTIPRGRDPSAPTLPIPEPSPSRRRLGLALGVIGVATALGVVIAIATRGHSAPPTETTAAPASEPPVEHTVAPEPPPVPSLPAVAPTIPDTVAIDAGVVDAPQAAPPPPPPPPSLTVRKKKPPVTTKKTTKKSSDDLYDDR